MDKKTLERFIAKINKQPEPGCWLWSAGKSRGGYGTFSLNRETPYAHRLAYELWRGPIPDGLCVLHECDTPACVKPDHLFLGTNLDNIADRVAKGRCSGGGIRGEKHSRTHLSEGDVLEIRKSYAAGGGTQAGLGKLYGVTGSTISDIVNRKTWGYVE